ncbi:type IV secretory system conjugative DNA transfer family protein [Burkholderia multivorans]|jgi:nucleoside-triphosphatase THEP1|uniref:AAA family ATPase n=1 Tax=Burkholderia multivorans TaxID=87883 RepID=UPI001C2179D1|nr:AAA family ATPase [Burkholderia multivorans]MBU9200223.1 type IV secretory system conjugative DNA transfer family protein [Burkholderia multivorans]MDN8078650.1 AAA family ATPase [Burkholderia multivorans]
MFNTLNGHRPKSAVPALADYLISGPAGSGKSTLVEELVDGALAANESVLIISVTREYREYCAAHHGTYLVALNDDSGGTLATLSQGPGPLVVLDLEHVTQWDLKAQLMQQLRGMHGQALFIVVDELAHVTNRVPGLVNEVAVLAKAGHRFCVVGQMADEVEPYADLSPRTRMLTLSVPKRKPTPAEARPEVDMAFLAARSGEGNPMLQQIRMAEALKAGQSVLAFQTNNEFTNFCRLAGGEHLVLLDDGPGRLGKFGDTRLYVVDVPKGAAQHAKFSVSTLFNRVEQARPGHAPSDLLVVVDDYPEVFRRAPALTQPVQRHGLKGGDCLLTVPAYMVMKPGAA